MAYDEQIEEIIEKTDMVDLVGEFVHLEKTGANYKGLCPFHDDKNPSFVVSPDKKIATCFACNTSVGPIDFIKKIKNVDFKEALAYVAGKAGVKVQIKKSNINKPNYDKYYKIMEVSEEFYKKNLLETKGGLEALDYLSKRGLTKEIIEKFDIGLSPSSSVLADMLKEYGFYELDISETGLIKSEDMKYHDIFLKRIMFPIKDEYGHIVAFSGRIYNKADDKSPKYVNSPETIIFKKHLNLYNLYNAIPDIRKKQRVILHEGQMDVIASVRAGFNEAVCSLGTALTKDQCELIKKYASEVIICYDADSAGMKASIRAYELLKQNNLNSKFVLLDGAKDPDEFILKYGIEKYQNYINDNLISLVEYEFLCLTKDKDFTNIEVVEDIKRRIFKILLNEGSQTLAEHYLNKFSNLANISYESLVIDYNNYSSSYKKDIKIKNNVSYQKPSNYKFISKYQIAELRLFKYAYLDKKYALEIDEKIDVTGFDKLHQKLWIELVENYYNHYESFDLDIFLSFISGLKDVYDTFVIDNKLLSSVIDIEFNYDDMNECIKVFKENSLKSELDALNHKINIEKDPKNKVLLTQKILEVKKNIAKINRK